MKNEFLLAIRALATEKNLPEGTVLEAVESALSSAFKKEDENAPAVVVRIDQDTGEIHTYLQRTVVEEVEHPGVEIAVAEARRYKPDARPGDVLDFETRTPEDAGRIAAQKAKQIVLQKLRESERRAIYEEYHGREGEMIVGTVQRIEPRQVILELARGTEAVLPLNEQVRNEHLRSGQRLKVIIYEVHEQAKGPQVVVSRSHRHLLRRLFEMEVPEIRNGTVEIKSIAREGGHRSKVAVHSRVPSIDPIGACVGMRGSRIQNIVNELGGERIDVIKWDPDPAKFVANALSPAQVIETEVDPENRFAAVTVPDRMFSLAIGKEGQNARLAAKLTGWKIQVRKQSTMEEAEGTTYEPFAAGEAPDIDIIAEAEEVAAAAEAQVEPTLASVAPADMPVEAAAPGAQEDEEFSFAAALQQIPVPRGEERESEDYGEEDYEDDEEEAYEVPAIVAPDQRPTAIRFAEDLLPKRPEEEEAPKKGAAKKQRRAPRFIEEDDVDDINYSGRIH